MDQRLEELRAGFDDLVTAVAEELVSARTESAALRAQLDEAHRYIDALLGSRIQPVASLGGARPTRQCRCGTRFEQQRYERLCPACTVTARVERRTRMQRARAIQAGSGQEEAV